MLCSYLSSDGSVTVAELSKDGVNIEKRLIEKGFAIVSKRYSNQCDWNKSIMKIKNIERFH
tara:strand:- start:174 stop:356 length:183 start_codon:yes stop_codon:yes gene_type:complete